MLLFCNTAEQINYLDMTDTDSEYLWFKMQKLLQ